MRALPLHVSFLAVFRRALVLLAALSFVLSGTASVHTAHAISIGQEALFAAASPSADEVATESCDSHDRKAPTSKQVKSFACCAFSCAPLMVLQQSPVVFVTALHGEVVAPLPQQAVMARIISGLFRPPRQNA
jgi:hypothetical protein